MQRFEASQWLEREEIVARQHQMLVTLARYMAQNLPYFAQRLKDAGLKPEDLATPKGLRKLPILTRREIQQQGEAMFNKTLPQGFMPISETRSSGSTGQPVIIKKTAANQMLWFANMMREHLWHKRDFSGRIMSIRATITEPKKQPCWGNPVDMLYPSGETIGIPIVFSAKQIIEVIQSFKPNNLVIYPNTLSDILLYAEKEKIKITGIDHVWSIGETLKPELRARAKKQLNASIEDDYSSQEMGIMALQCPESGLYHIMAESLIIEILNENGEPCKAGEVGKVMATDLHNYAMPMIRYEIGDYAEVAGDCPCGRGLPALKAVKGRSRNLVLKPDGTRHWPPLSLAMVRSKVPMQQFQLVQHSLEDIEVKLVLDSPASAQQEQAITDELHKALDYPFNIRFTYFTGRIPTRPNGKFEDFISHV